VIAALVVVAALAARAQAIVVTRGPYLQMPTPTSIMVRWRTDVASNSRVRFGAAPGSLTSMADDATSTTEHAVTVTGLSPDTLYYYAIGSSSGTLEGGDADHFFRTQPVAGPARPMRIWVTGDGGFANANGQAVRDAYATYNAGGATDFWLLLGDNAYLLGSDADYQAALFDMHHDLLRTVPVWSTFGNHEDFSADDLTGTGPYFDLFSFPTAGESGGVASGSEAYYSFDFANVHFIVLDSEGPAGGPAGTPGLPLPTDPMMVWLVADLQATTADWVIALWHRPPYSKGFFHDSDVEVNEINMRTNVLPTLEDYGVDLVLTGHSHSYERSYLLDGHYGPSTSITGAHRLDSGDGKPAGDGAYRKETVGKAPHEGEVHAVCGSSSEVRPVTLNHPAHRVGLLELGSMVIDISGNTLTARFLNSDVAVTDEFQIVKGPSCPPAPQSGCEAGAGGKLLLKNDADDGKDLLRWKWQEGQLDAAEVGAPQAQADLALCLYDATGLLLGGRMGKGALWKANASGDLKYSDPLAAYGGLRKAKIKPGKAQISVGGKGAGLAMPALPLVPPLTTQLVQLDNGSCWESVFPAASKNDPGKLLATIP
jgi:hypothetical protein